MTSSAEAKLGDQVKGPTCHAHGITGFGNPAGGVVFVGIAPARIETQTGRPFTGASGKLLDAVLDACGVPRSTVYATNVICWWKDAPEVAEIIACFPRLKAELEWAKPKLVVTLGEIATTTILGKSMKGLRGAVMWNGKFYIMPNIPPCGHV